MICKYCYAELEEGVTVCPTCGKDNLQEEQNEELLAEEMETEETATVEETVEDAPEISTVFPFCSCLDARR